jgi:hypothetical protein
MRRIFNKSTRRFHKNGDLKIRNHDDTQQNNEKMPPYLLIFRSLMNWKRIEQSQSCR